MGPAVANFELMINSLMMNRVNLICIIFVALGIGGLLIAVGVLMIVVHILTEDDADVVEKTLEKYKAKMTRSASQNPIIEDVEYGVDSRRSSFGVPVNPNYIPNIG